METKQLIPQPWELEPSQRGGEGDRRGGEGLCGGGMEGYVYMLAILTQDDCPLSNTNTR